MILKPLPGKVLLICDLDNGACSVTNDIENVVDQICKQESISPTDVVIACEDSDDTWDGWDYVTKAFIYIGGRVPQDVFDCYFSFEKQAHDQLKDFTNQCEGLFAQREI